MNKVFYVFKDGTKTSSYSNAKELVEEKGNYEITFEYEECKEMYEENKKSGKTIKSKVRN